MNRLVITNQRGGVAKTTTTLNLAWYLAERGKRVLIVDTDPQASVNEVLGLKPTMSLYNFLVDQRALDTCVTRTSHQNIDVLASSRETNKAEDIVSTQTAREHAFVHTLRGPDQVYDWVLIDCAPSIGLFQACAMTYARKVLVPVAMETLSVQGAISAFEAARTLTRLLLLDPPIEVVGVVPVDVDRRLQITETVLRALPTLCRDKGVRLLTHIRTDTNVSKAARAKKFLYEFDPKTKSAEDYDQLTAELLRIMEGDHVEESGSSSAEATKA